jgi:hypothetical protein
MRTITTVAALLVALFGVPVAALAHECVVYEVFFPDELRKGRTVSVGLFGVEGTSGDTERVRTLQVYAAERMVEQLSRLKYFSAVRVASAESPSARGELHVEGSITSANPGSRWLRVALRGGAAKARVRGNVRLQSGAVLFEFECEGAELGGMFGVGGLSAMFDSPDDLLRKNFAKFGEDFAKAIKEIDNARQQQGRNKSRKRSPSEGTTVRKDKPWRQRPIEAWTPADHSKEVAAFVVETQNRDWFRIHAAWLTRSAYRSNTYLNEADFPGSDHLFDDGLLPDLTPITKLIEQPVYLIGVTFESAATDGSTDGDEPPFFSIDDTIRDATYLARKGDSSGRFLATEAIRLRPYLQRRGAFKSRWRNVPVVFAFGVQNQSGDPLVRALTDEIELHTRVDGRDAVVRFRLADFELTGLGELRASVEARP